MPEDTTTEEQDPLETLSETDRKVLETLTPDGRRAIGLLGDTGAKALAAERDARSKAEKAAKAAATKASTLEAEVAKFREQDGKQQTETEKMLAQVRAETAEREKAMNMRLLRSEVTAAAAGKLANPALAPKLVDLAELAADDGDFDRAAIAAAVESLVKENPGLAATASGRVTGDAGGGTRGGAKPRNMNDLIRKAAGR